MNRSPLNGLLAIHKPHGMVSKDVSRWLTKRYGKLKLGHVGTLDPAATGVLPLLLGKATRLQDYLLDLPKSYEFDIEFGFETTTLDMEGEVLHRQEQPPTLSYEQIVAAANELQGKIRQVPPIYSAVKYQGKALYDYARSGKGDEVPLDDLARTVEEHQIDVLNSRPAGATLLVTCSKGTYIRVLVKDLAAKLGTFGTLTRLVRTKAAGLDLSQTHTLEDVEGGIEDLASFLTPLENIDLGMKRWTSPTKAIETKLSSGQEVIVDSETFLQGSDCCDKKSMPEPWAQPLVLLDCGGKAYGVGAVKLHAANRIMINMKRGLK